MNKIAVFMHVALMDNYKEINEEIWSQMIKSGLLDAIDKLYITIVGDGDFDMPTKIWNKAKILSRENDIERFEFPCIEAITDFARENKDFIIMKCHNSGTSHNADSIKYPNWRRLQIHTMINRWKECLSALKSSEINAVGIETQKDPMTHFSGNWWWTTSKYVNELPKRALEQMQQLTPGGIGMGVAPNKRRHAAEFWLGCHPNKKWGSLFQSGHHWIESKEIMAEVENYFSVLLKEEKYWENI